VGRCVCYKSSRRWAAFPFISNLVLPPYKHLVDEGEYGSSNGQGKDDCRTLGVLGTISLWEQVS
jgi:hypothetical protein